MTNVLPKFAVNRSHVRLSENISTNLSSENGPRKFELSITQPYIARFCWKLGLQALGIVIKTKNDRRDAVGTVKSQFKCIANCCFFYRVNTKSTPPPATFVDISAVIANFCMKFYVTVKRSNIHFITKFGWNISEIDKIMPFQPRQPAFLSVRAACRTDWMRTGSLRRLSRPQALHI